MNTLNREDYIQMLTSTLELYTELSIPTDMFTVMFTWKIAWVDCTMERNERKSGTNW